MYAYPMEILMKKIGAVGDPKRHILLYGGSSWRASRHVTSSMFHLASETVTESSMLIRFGSSTSFPLSLSLHSRLFFGLTEVRKMHPSEAAGFPSHPHCALLNNTDGK